MAANRGLFVIALDPAYVPGASGGPGAAYLLKLAVALAATLGVGVAVRVSVDQLEVSLLNVISPATLPSPPALDVEEPAGIVMVALAVNVPADFVTSTETPPVGAAIGFPY
jgi:hypothetical protein